MLKGNLEYKSEEQISAIKNIQKLYKGRKKVISFHNAYTRMVSEAKSGLPAVFKIFFQGYF